MKLSIKKKLNKLSSGAQSKIVLYKLEEDVVNLKLAGLTHEQIANEMNKNGKLPKGEQITAYMVQGFLAKIPEVTKAIVRQNNSRLVKVVNNNLDILTEINSMFKRTKTLLDQMELKAAEKDKHINPYQYKAVASELRETLRLMLDISKDMNDFENIKRFMQIILEVLKAEAPQAIPKIIERLKLAKGTNWFSEMLK